MAAIMNPLGWLVGRPHRHRVIWAIRILLIGSMLAKTAQIVVHVVHHETRGPLGNAITRDVELVLWGALTLGLTFLHEYFEKHKNVHIPALVEAGMVVFLYASLFLSVRLNLYYNVWWWDVVLHTIAGMLLAFVGFLVVYKVSGDGMSLSPLLVALFSFTFSVTGGVLFEIVEFGCDVALGTATQSWDLPADSIEIGRSEQGLGLRDTMSDLIVDTGGAALISVLCFLLYRDEKKKAQALLESVFPDETTPAG